jgi:lysophospholipase L1-like esterase
MQLRRKPIRKHIKALRTLNTLIFISISTNEISILLMHVKRFSGSVCISSPYQFIYFTQIGLLVRNILKAQRTDDNLF